VGTVGRLDVRPDLVNVVPGAATVTVDLRNTDDEVLGRAEQELAEEVDRLAAAEGVEVVVRSLARYGPVEFDLATVDLVEATARDLGYSTRRLPSGAGHDAQMLARICPTAMIFTPSVRGLSHNIAEHTHPHDVAAGANVLLHTLLALAE
jgi:N-carbamoyl-L-amino-acid hydrolase